MTAPSATPPVIDAKRCIGCAACATAAPANFRVVKGKAQLLAAPRNEAEYRGTEGARALCPTQAIGPCPRPSPPPLQASDEQSTAQQPTAPHAVTARDLFPEVAQIAEDARWKIGDLPWSRFDAGAATPALRAVVHEMAFSEQTTFSATQRFMQAFAEDVDFTQWVSVWFYEETRHPMVLLRWLQVAGERVAPDFASRGRVSAPFMKSRTGTLTTNVISEIVAANAYLALAESTPEPLLAAISLRIAADEARHAASFFTYARATIERSKSPERERLDALKVLHFWLNETQAVTHPVNQSMEKFRAMGQDAGLGLTFATPVDRICRAVAALTGFDLPGPEHVAALLLEQTARVHQGG